MRWGRWKLVREYEKPWELFDISRDRTEMQNLAEEEAVQKKQMIQMWTTWATKNGVAFPKRFNMYQFLNQKKQAERKQPKK